MAPECLQKTICSLICISSSNIRTHLSLSGDELTFDALISILSTSEENPGFAST